MHYLEIKEIMQLQNILAVVGVMLLQKLQQFDFIQALVEEILAIFDNLKQEFREGHQTTTRIRGPKGQQP